MYIMVIKIIILLNLIFIPFNNMNAEEINLNKLRQIYFKALNDDSAVVTGKELAQNFTTSLGRMYFASFLCLEARDTYWPVKKWNLAQSGLKIMDREVKSHPNSVEHRILKVAVTSHLPFFFHRSTEAKQDVKWIRQQQTQGNVPDEFNEFTTNFLKKAVEILDLNHN
jgi:hypothetical protein